MPKPVTIISGATKGIGRACAEHLTTEGHQVIGLARSKPDDEFPGEFYAVDFSDRQQTDATINEVVKKYTINGVVNNVGATSPQLIGDIDIETVENVMQLNFYSAIQLVQACVTSMREQNYGRIVNISSELALGLATRTAYGGAKAALISASRTWALELAKFGITANAIAPGPIDTDLFNKNNPVGSEIRQQKLDRIPLGRIGDPDDVANAVSFFLSPKSGFITGQTLFICGGSSLGAGGLL